MNGTTRDNGSAAVEFALVFPILLLLISAIIDFGRLYFEQASLSGAAREGVRQVALGKTDGDAVSQTVEDAAGNTALQVTVKVDGAWTTLVDDMNSGASVSGVTIPDCTPGDEVTVVANETFTFWTPVPNLFGVFGGQETVGGKGVMRCGG
jgi:Flp pilus assembly protein TadG